MEDKEFITSRGPVLSPILVGLEGRKGAEAEVRIKYILETKEDTLSSRSRSGLFDDLSSMMRQGSCV